MNILKIYAIRFEIAQVRSFSIKTTTVTAVSILKVLHRSDDHLEYRVRFPGYFFRSQIQTFCQIYNIIKQL